MKEGKTHLVEVVIPFYRESMERWEECALDNTMHTLQNHPISFLKPEGLNIDRWRKKYPKARIVSVSEEWLGTVNGIGGYNRMMMSADFYRLFSSSEYILICQTDAWIFRDELEHWCSFGYDIVAAPWPLRPRYRCFPLKQWLKWRAAMDLKKQGYSRLDMYGKVGNGGLCLRRVDACISVCEEQHENIEQNLKRGYPYEDVFWAMQESNFKYPTAEEALKFSFDTKPQLCYALNHKRLPMGCHGFNHKSRWDFWNKYIPCLND